MVDVAGGIQVKGNEERMKLESLPMPIGWNKI
jgi:hypothetical protein